MSTFYAYYTGPNSKNTVGYNNSLQKLKATTEAAAEKEAQENFSNMDHFGIDRIQILEVCTVTNLNVPVIKKALAAAHRASEIKRVEAEERAHYERVKKIYDRH